LELARASSSRQFDRITLEEFWANLTTVGVGNFVRIMIQYPGNTLVALTVSICVWLIILMSKIIGGLLPILAKKLKMDPAIMAAPLITTAVDMLSLVIYFNIAKVLLKGMII